MLKQIDNALAKHFGLVALLVVTALFFWAGLGSDVQVW